MSDMSFARPDQPILPSRTVLGFQTSSPKISWAAVGYENISEVIPELRLITSRLCICKDPQIAVSPTTDSESEYPLARRRFARQWVPYKTSTSVLSIFLSLLVWSYRTEFLLSQNQSFSLTSVCGHACMPEEQPRLRLRFWYYPQVVQATILTF